MSVEHQPKWRHILACGTVVAVLTCVLILIAQGVDRSQLLPAVTNLGLVSLIVWLVWRLFERVAWRWPCLRWHGWLVTTPDLNGRWVGKYVSKWDREERPMVLEIRQTLLKVQCVAFGLDNVGESYGACLLCDGDEQLFKLMYYYHNKREPTEAKAGDDHEGMAILRVIPGPHPRLDGYYVNDRHPKGQKGRVELVWEGRALKNTRT